jgi:hypothetical protein
MSGLLASLFSILGALNYLFSALLHIDGAGWAGFFGLCTVIWLLCIYGPKLLRDLHGVLLSVGRAFTSAADRIEAFSKTLSRVYDAPHKKTRSLGRRKQRLAFERRVVIFGLLFLVCGAGLAFYTGYNVRTAERKPEPLRPPYGQSFADRFNGWPFLEPGRGGPAMESPPVAQPQETLPPLQAFPARSQKSPKRRAMSDPWSFPKF